MTEDGQKKREQLAEELEDLVNRYAEETEIGMATLIGMLTMFTNYLIHISLFDDEDDGDDGDWWKK